MKFIPDCYICGRTLGGNLGVDSWGRACKICGQYACHEGGHLSGDDICVNSERKLPVVNCITCGRETNRSVNRKCHACHMRTAAAQYHHRR